MQLSEKILRILSAKKMSGRELALSTGVSSSAIQNIVNGDTKDPGAKKLLAIARALQVPLEWLADDDADGIPQKQSDGDKAIDIISMTDSYSDFQELCKKRGGADVVLAAGAILLMDALGGASFLDDVTLPEELREEEWIVTDFQDQTSMHATDILFKAVGQKSLLDLDPNELWRLGYLSSPPPPAAGKITPEPIGAKPRKKAAKKRGQDESRGGKSKP